MRISYRAAVRVVCVAAAIAWTVALLELGLIRLDTYHVIGISAGTDTSYCSAEIQHLRLHLTCEHAP